jgi:hypothetical protein
MASPGSDDAAASCGDAAGECSHDHRDHSHGHSAKHKKHHTHAYGGNSGSGSGAGASGHSQDGPAALSLPSATAEEDAKYTDQLAALQAWREDVSPSLSERGKAFIAPEATLRRYLRARNGDVDAARENLVETLAWRESNLVPPYHCPACDAAPAAHCFLPLGWDAKSRPIIFGNPARAAESATGPTIHHVVTGLEVALSHPRSAETWVWCVEFKGFGLSHALNARLGITTASVFSRHFCERVGLILLINAPSVFQLLLSALRPFADPRTLDKVRFLTGDAAAVAAQLRDEYGFGEEATEYVRAALDLPGTPGNVPPRLPADGLLMGLPHDLKKAAAAAGPED